MSSSSSSSVSRQKYEVFLSFRGEDTRNNFTDHLYAALKRKGIITFKDDQNLEPGNEIKPELLEAIQESCCSIIVFSETYAFSSWCLEELAAIVQQRKEREHKIFPIFYYVDPSDLGKQKGEVEKAFSKHEERYKENKDRTQRWRDALTEVAKITGWHLENKPESEFIEGIVQKIYSVVPLRSIFSSKDFMPSKSSTFILNQIIKALNTNDMNMIGLYGMPGLGKTTLAKEVGKHVKQQKLFDNLVMVTMSQNPDINKIQDRIAESLDLKFEKTTVEGKAEELWRKLKRMNHTFFNKSQSLMAFKVHNCPRLNQQRVAVHGEFEKVPLYDFKGLLCNAKKLSMYQVDYERKIFLYLPQGKMIEFTVLTLVDKELECLMDTTYQGPTLAGTLFNLVELRIEKMSGLKMLCNGPFPKRFLQNLEKLEICNCKELICLIPALQKLKKVEIINCDQLQQVFLTDGLEENKAPIMSNLTSLELKSLPELKWIWKGPCHYVNLQSLKVAVIYDCNRLKYLFSPSLAQSLVQQQQLKIESCGGLEHIITTEPDGGHLHSPFLPKLTSLEIDRCAMLEYVFKIDLDKGLPHLKSLSITDVAQLKQVFINVAKQKNAVGHAFALPCLQCLQLEQLINLNCFCSENYPIVSPSLEKLTVKDCPRMENFAIQQVNKEVQLKELHLSRLKNDNVCDAINCQKIFQIEVGHFLSMTEIIKLVSIHQLQGPIQAASLQYLRELTPFPVSKIYGFIGAAICLLKEGIVDDQSTCRTWNYSEVPKYTTMGETKIMTERKRKFQETDFS
ncbi:hypothetical protein DITRI_Ditri01bG0177500 [Diplodiscus trichospermus]